MTWNDRDEQIERLVEHWAWRGVVKLGDPDEFSNDADVVSRAATEAFAYLDRAGLTDGTR